MVCNGLKKNSFILIWSVERLLPSHWMSSYVFTTTEAHSTSNLPVSVSASASGTMFTDGLVCHIWNPHVKCFPYRIVLLSVFQLIQNYNTTWEHRHRKMKRHCNDRQCLNWFEFGKVNKYRLDYYLSIFNENNNVFTLGALGSIKT